MSSNRERRVAKELRDIAADRDNSGVFAEAVNNSNLMHLRGSLPGPPDTPYAGGTYWVDIVIPDTYPFKPPTIKFTTQMWHPNISSVTGAICLDILSTSWSPVQNIKSALMSLRLLLENPNPKDPQDAEVSKMMIQEPARFARVANEWAAKYAGAPRQENLQNFDALQDAKAEIDYGGWHKDLVERFTAMGFAAEDVVGAFRLLGIEKQGGSFYQLEEAYVGDIIAQLLGED
ncbi:Ubiquitin-conjugating enzyme E2 1 [Ceratocystis pirilliformis]|uniref:Ubiquitin-conjugating enzyme E2 2 n=1 Tax=Ceratocystis pirilliformis TaxID=259994 RepID=A0ABR3YMT2_9PEZI